MSQHAAYSTEWLPETFIAKNRYNGCRSECLRIGGYPVVSNQFVIAGEPPAEPLPPGWAQRGRWFIHEYLFATDCMRTDPDIPEAAVTAYFPRPPKMDRKMRR